MSRALSLAGGPATALGSETGVSGVKEGEKKGRKKWEGEGKREEDYEGRRDEEESVGRNIEHRMVEGGG